MSLAFTVGGIIGGVLIPLLAQQLSASGHPGMTGLLSLTAIITLIGTRNGRARHF